MVAFSYGYNMNGFFIAVAIGILLIVTFQIAILSVISVFVTMTTRWVVQKLFGKPFNSFIFLIITIFINILVLLVFRSNERACSGIFYQTCYVNLVIAIIIALILGTIGWRAYLSMSLVFSDKNQSRTTLPTSTKKKRK